MAENQSGTTSSISEDEMMAKFSDVEWIRARLRSYQISSSLQDYFADFETHYTTAEEVLKGERDAYGSLEENITKREVQERILHLSQLHRELENILFSQEPQDHQNPQTQEIRKHVDRIHELERDHLHILADMEPLKCELSKLKLENRELMESNRALMTRVTEVKKNQVSSSANSRQCRELQDQYDLILKKLDLTQNCFQAIILGCGVSWQDDDKLLDLVESLGRSIDCPTDTP